MMFGRLIQYLILTSLFLNIVYAQEALYIITLPQFLWENSRGVELFFQSLKQRGIELIASRPNHEYIISIKEEEKDNLQNIHRELSTEKHLRKFRKHANNANSATQLVVYSILNRPKILEYLPYRLPDVKISYTSSGRGKKNNIAILTFGKDSIKYINETANLLSIHDAILYVDFFKPHYVSNYNAIQLFTLGKDIHDTQNLPGLLPPNQGRGITVAIADTGIDLSHCYFKSKDPPIFLTLNPSNKDELSHRIVSHISRKKEKLGGTAYFADNKVLAYLSIKLQEDTLVLETDFIDEKNGHGTHVAGSAVGGTGLCNPPQEIRNDAKVIFFDVANNAPTNTNTSSDEAGGGGGGGSLLVPYNLYDVLALAYEGGARIFTNSWGSQTESMYSHFAMQVDLFIHEHDDMLILFAAGNSGPTMGTIGSPAIAKNCITIGAHFNSYQSFLTSSLHKEVWETEESFKWSTKDVLDKKGVYTEDNLCYFSSRGPTRDGRIKPDITVAGCNIISSRAGSSNSSSLLKMDGTSMATPLAARAAIYIEERLKEVYGIPHASASLKKAIMITCTNHMTGSSQRFSLEGDRNLHLLQIKDINRTKLTYQDEGFGRLNLLPFSQGRLAWVDRIPIFTSDKVRVYSFNVSHDILDEVVFTLVWTDIPSLPDKSLTKTLINDVDLQVQILNEKLQLIQVINSNQGTTPDRLNNVEQVRIPHLKKGSSIHVLIKPFSSISYFSTPYQLVSFVYTTHPAIDAFNFTARNLDIIYKETCLGGLGIKRNISSCVILDRDIESHNTSKRLLSAPLRDSTPHHYTALYMLMLTVVLVVFFIGFFITLYSKGRKLK